jgi:hypothetical protein
MICQQLDTKLEVHVRYSTQMKWAMIVALATVLSLSLAQSSNQALAH